MPGRGGQRRARHGAIALDCGIQAKSEADAIHRAVYVGGDRDTTASMAAAIAEARFGLDAESVEQTLARVSNEMHPVIQALYARVGKPMANPTPTCNTAQDAEEKKSFSASNSCGGYRDWGVDIPVYFEGER